MAKVVYNTSAWRAARKATLWRDGNRCRLNFEGCTHVATTADHVVELDDGGAPYDLRNLQASCRHCNLVKGHLARRLRYERAMVPVRKW
jgi:5-methylcytosine-specific restriction endonuclease McrA